MVSIIIPCFNEEKTIFTVLQRLFLLEIEIEIIVINDGSTDGTRRKLNSIINPPDNLKIIHLEKNQGKGNALNIGIPIARGKIVVIFDADLEYDEREIIELIRPIWEDKADVVYGSRFNGSKPHRVLYFSHYLANKFLTFLSNCTTGLNLSDMETCMKAFKTYLIQNIQIKEKRFACEPEITAKIARTGCRIFEIGISYYGRTYQEGKKIRFKDGLRAIWCILKYWRLK